MGGQLWELLLPAAAASQAVPLLCKARSGASGGARPPDAAARRRRRAAARAWHRGGRLSQPGSWEERQGGPASEADGEGGQARHSLHTAINRQGGTQWIFQSRGWGTLPSGLGLQRGPAARSHKMLSSWHFWWKSQFLKGDFLAPLINGKQRFQGGKSNSFWLGAHFFSLFCFFAFHAFKSFLKKTR